MYARLLWVEIELKHKSLPVNCEMCLQMVVIHNILILIRWLTEGIEQFSGEFAAELEKDVLQYEVSVHIAGVFDLYTTNRRCAVKAIYVTIA